MKYTLSIPYKEFSKTLAGFKIEGKSILMKSDSSILITESENWRNKVEKYLIDSIEPTADDFTYKFKYREPLIDFYMWKDEDNEEKRVNRALKKEIENLTYIENLCSIIEPFQDMAWSCEQIETVQGRLDFVLAKLYLVFNENYFSIREILSFNGFDVRSGESMQIAELLDKKGYAEKKEKYSPDKDDVRITVKGAAYIERKNKSQLKKKKLNESEEINTKIDLVLAKLEALGFGQEIVFNEIEELKDLYGKIPKKSWQQLIKGKLIDLGLSEVLSKEAIQFVYESLTNEALKLL